MTPQSLLELPTNGLLDKFGKGSHSPGSGSATALMGLLSIKLITTVAILTINKPNYSDKKSEMEFILDSILKNYEPKLKDYFDEDAKVFNEVIELRKKRDKSENKIDKERYSRLALEKLKEATDIPFNIAEVCLNIVDLGMVVFEKGFQAARGDSGVAISAAIAGVTSALFIINLNLESFKQSDWAKTKRVKAEDLRKKMLEKQDSCYRQLLKLNREDIEDILSQQSKMDI